jgi:hypothetical protein
MCETGTCWWSPKLDRLARSIRDLCSIVDRLTVKGVSLRILGMGWTPARPMGGQTILACGLRAKGGQAGVQGAELGFSRLEGDTMRGEGFACG